MIKHTRPTMEATPSPEGHSQLDTVISYCLIIKHSRGMHDPQATNSSLGFSPGAQLPTYFIAECDLFKPLFIQTQPWNLHPEPVQCLRPPGVCLSFQIGLSVSFLVTCSVFLGIVFSSLILLSTRSLWTCHLFNPFSACLYLIYTYHYVNFSVWSKSLISVIKTEWKCLWPLTAKWVALGESKPIKLTKIYFFQWILTSQRNKLNHQHFWCDLLFWQWDTLKYGALESWILYNENCNFRSKVFLIVCPPIHCLSPLNWGGEIKVRV